MSLSASADRHSPLRGKLARIFNVTPEEAPAVFAGVAVFFLLFAGYFMLRPVREAMGIAGGVQNLSWLFTGTFVATIAVVPLFGWVAAKVPRRRILPCTYLFLAATLVAFGLAFLFVRDDANIARAFYIWLSVFNLLAVSVAWAVLADLFAMGQAKRLFPLMAAGSSFGGLVGPLLGVLLVGRIGQAGLLLLSAVLIVGSAVAAWRLQCWRDRHPLHAGEAVARTRPLGGNPLEGFSTVFRSRFLIGTAVFVLLMASINTFLYFEQARLVAVTFPVREDQIRVFGLIDSIVQTLAILSQLFITGRLAERLGVGVLLVGVALIMAGAFLWLAVAPVFGVLAVIMVIRRAGEYAFVRPGREMLFTTVPVDQKYKAKSFIDTVAYRGADAVSAWVKTGVDLLAQQPAVVALLGAGLALAWAATGRWLARMQPEAAAAGEGDAATRSDSAQMAFPAVRQPLPAR